MDPLWVSVGVTVVLVFITGYYACQTRKIAKTSEDTARAALEQAEELRQQRVNASQPVLWPMIWGWDGSKLEVILENIGNGPALDIDIYLYRGEDLVVSDCEYVWYSYMTASGRKNHKFLAQPRRQTAMGAELPGLDTLKKLVGKYTILVEWRDLYKSGPFFQAKLPFNLAMDSDKKLHASEEAVVIDTVSQRRKER
jgi:hypothetical protein